MWNSSSTDYRGTQLYELRLDEGFKYGQRSAMNTNIWINSL